MGRIGNKTPLLVLLLLCYAQFIFTQEIPANYKFRKALNTDCWGYSDADFHYEGDCINGKITGKGVMYLRLENNDANMSVGEFYEGKWNGYIKSCYIYTAGLDHLTEGICSRPIFEGFWKMDQRHGLCKLYYDNGKLEFDGYWENGEKNGYGKEYSYDGKLLREGYWVNNEYIGARLTSSGNTIHSSQGVNKIDLKLLSEKVNAVSNNYFAMINLIGSGQCSLSDREAFISSTVRDCFFKENVRVFNDLGTGGVRDYAVRDYLGTIISTYPNKEGVVFSFSDNQLYGPYRSLENFVFYIVRLNRYIRGINNSRIFIENHENLDLYIRFEIKDNRVIYHPTIYDIRKAEGNPDARFTSLE